MTKFYAIKSIEEARKYLEYQILGTRLVESAEAVLSLEGLSIKEIFGWEHAYKNSELLRVDSPPPKCHVAALAFRNRNSQIFLCDDYGKV